MPRQKKWLSERNVRFSTNETDNIDSHVHVEDESVQPQPSTSTSTPPQFVESRTQQKYVHFENEMDSSAISSSEVQRTIVDMSTINALVGQLACPQCKSCDTISLRQGSRFGLVFEMFVFCTECNNDVVGPVFTSPSTSDSSSRNQPYVINKAAVLAANQVGLGSCKFNNFCELLDLPGMHHSTFHKYSAVLFNQNESVAADVFQNACGIIHDAHLQMGHELDSEGIMNIAVSYDGSWMTRGHKSQVGIGAAVDVLTGLVVDAHIMSLHCQLCSTTGTRLKKQSDTQYKEWFDAHVESGDCEKNFSGTSGMMEVEAAKVIWSRSIERYKLRYVTLVGDGDSKAYNTVRDLQPYGEDHPIVKEECMNHVGKRMGTALRSLVSDCSKRKVTLGGRGHGKLTADTIKKLTNYYNRAIRKFTTVPEMKQAILASLFHSYSTDDYPRHQYCPPGKNSWCFYKKALANHRFPFDHKKRIHTPLDFQLIHEHILPIYERLSDDKLLQRCEKKATQNSNESYHNSVWSKCSKTSFHSLPKVQMAVFTAAAEFNFGPSYILNIKKQFNLPSGEHSARLAKSRAKKRETKSLVKNALVEQKRRKMRNEAIDKCEKEAEESEAQGGPGIGYKTAAF